MIYETIEYPWGEGRIDYDSFEVRTVNDSKNYLMDRCVIYQQNDMAKIYTVFGLLKCAAENYSEFKEYNSYCFGYSLNGDKIHVALRKNIHYE